jgi:DUF4097 and DUF4098 domain-containing protein YvlB
MALMGLVGCAQQLLGATAKERVERTIPLNKGGTFSLDNVNGKVVVTLAKGDEVHIVAEKTVRAMEEAKAKAGLSKLEVAIESTPQTIRVESRFPKSQGLFSSAGFSGSVDYTVEVPAGTHIALSSVNGAITVDTPGSQVTCETTNGSVEVVGAELLKAATVNGKIRFDAENIEEINSTNGGIDGTIRSAAPSRGKVGTVNGHVTIALSPKASLRVEAENVNGGLSSDLPGITRSKHSLQGDLNGGGKTLSIETVNGGIEIRPAP